MGTYFLELIENAGAPILYILQLTSGGPVLSRGACSLRGTCAKKHHNRYAEDGQDTKVDIIKFSLKMFWDRYCCINKVGFQQDELVGFFSFLQVSLISRHLSEHLCYCFITPSY